MAGAGTLAWKLPMKRLYQEEEKRQTLLSQKLEGEPNRYRRLLKIFIILIVSVVILEVWMMNRLSTNGNKIQELKIAKSDLELENQVLENKISQVTSLQALEEKAIALGFETIKHVEYPTKPSDLASAK